MGLPTVIYSAPVMLREPLYEYDIDYTRKLLGVLARITQHRDKYPIRYSTVSNIERAFETELVNHLGLHIGDLIVDGLYHRYWEGGVNCNITNLCIYSRWSEIFYPALKDNTDTMARIEHDIQNYVNWELSNPNLRTILSGYTLENIERTPSMVRLMVSENWL